MKTYIQPTKALMIAALVIVAIGCSEFTAPTASVPPETATDNQQYAPIEDVIASVEAAGYRVMNLEQVALDDCDTISTTRAARVGQGSIINIAGICKLTVPGTSLPYDMDITVVAPSSCIGVCDFYPHPTQFVGNVEIRWDTQDFDLPEGVEFDDIIPLYVHDDGTIEEVSFVRSQSRFITVTTNHFSRYIITSRVGS